MRRFSRSRTFTRARLVNALLFVIFGIVITVRTATAVGPKTAAIPGVVLGLAMIALGAFRYRDYNRMKRAP